MNSPSRANLSAPSIHVIGEATTADDSTERFLADVCAGLSRSPKAIPSFYIYDESGSELFRRIMELDEYYPTRTERAILEQHGGRIAEPFRDRPCDIVDLGAGDGLKTRVLLEHLRSAGADPRYLPVDISKEAIESALEECARQQPWLRAEGVVAEYFDALRWLSAQDSNRRRLVLWLGSNVGNLVPDAARQFFRRLRDAMNPGDCLLTGFDLVKDPRILERAYDDGAGVTAEFNLNLLRRINRELGADFRIEAFRHFARYAPLQQRMESCLLSTEEQVVSIAGRKFRIQAWEPIHTEVSCKYRPNDIESFAQAAGFEEIGHFSDAQDRFIDALWRVPGATP